MISLILQRTIMVFIEINVANQIVKTFFIQSLSRRKKTDAIHFNKSVSCVISHSRLMNTHKLDAVDGIEDGILSM